MPGTLENTLEHVERLRRQGALFCVVTIVRTANATSAKAGAKAVNTDDGTLHGYIGGSCVQGAAIKAAKTALEEAAPRLIRVKPREEVIEQLDRDGVELYKSICPSGGTVDMFVEPVCSAPRLFVLGSSPVAATCVRLCRALGWHVTVAALEEDHDQVPGADRYLSAFSLLDPAPRPRDPVIVATQGKRDREALRAALGSGAGWVGMVSSRRKAAKLKQQLSGDVPSERLAVLSAPAGIDINAVAPEEIALSILGEIVAFRHGQVRVADTGAVAESGPRRIIGGSLV